MFHFDLEKAIQALALLLRQPGVDQRSYLKLIKLLYLAERESLRETGRPLIGDRLVAMRHGPVLSHVCDLMRGEVSHPGWSSNFSALTNCEIDVVKDPGTDRLCKYEVEKLRSLSDVHRGRDRWQMRDLTHELPEWRQNDPGDSSRPIPLEDVLEGSEQAACRQAIERAAEADLAFARAFGF